jgi:HAD superfamily hydrolase (TIGR01509 family)
MNVIFDLDGCLYPADEERIRENIHKYAGNISTTRNAYLELKKHNVQFDPDDYWQFIRNVPIKPEPEVSLFIQNLVRNGVTCWIFTNCREREAKETLEKLGISPSLFKGIFGIDFTEPYCKPEREAFEKVLRVTGSNAIMFDDTAENLVTARACGLHTVHVRDLRHLIKVFSLGINNDT